MAGSSSRSTEAKEPGPLPSSSKLADGRRKRGLSLSARLPPWALKARPMAAPVLVAFLAFVFVVVDDLNRLAGQYAFLCYTSVVLFFFPRGRVSQQLENNTINFLGAVVGQAWSAATVAVAGHYGKRYGRDASQARAALGIGLAIISLISGTLRSYAPRLNVSCRASMFYTIFILTTLQTTTEFTASVFLNPFFVALFAYAFSTIVGVTLSEHSSSPQLAAQIIRSVHITCELLPVSLTTILDAAGADSPGISPENELLRNQTRDTGVSEKTLEEQPVPPLRSRQQRLARELRAEIATVRTTYAAYALDIVLARQHPSALIPVVRSLGRLQRNAILGPTAHVPGERIRTALERTYASPASHRTSLSGTLSRRSASHTSLSSLRSRSGERGRSRDRSPPPPPSSAPVFGVQLASQLSKVATHSWEPRRTLHVNTDSTVLPSPARMKLTQTCEVLSDAIIDALKFAADDIALSCDLLQERDDHDESADDMSDADSTKNVKNIKSQLQTALGDLEKRLSGIIEFGEFGSHGHTPKGTATPANGPASPTVPITPRTVRSVVFEDQMTSADWLDDDDRFRIAFYMIALLDLAKDATNLLDYAVHLRSVSSDKPKRWIFPTIIWPWTKVTPETPNTEHTITGELPAEEAIDDDENHEDLDFAHAALMQDLRPQMPPNPHWKTRVAIAWRSVWDRHGVVFARLAISKGLHKLKHSRHVHFAIKQTIGVSLLSLPAFLPLGNAGRTWFDDSRGTWMVVSFMFVIEVTTGATLRIGFYRMLGTFIGAVVGYLCVLIAGENPHGLVALATVCAVPISYTILFTSIEPIGIITGITLPPIVFIKYLHLNGGRSVFQLAWERFVDIVIGIAAAILIGMWLWPIHARVRYFRAVADTMDQITEYYLRMSRDLLRPGLVYQANNKQYSMIEAAVRRNITRSRRLVSVQKQEISLLPRPIKLYSETIDLMERLFETFAEVRTLRFSLPRKATVLDVLPIRRELVSALLINLWATAQAFRSRSPLPQLLPSPRVPLGEVMETTDEHAHFVRSRRAKQNLRRRWAFNDDNDNDENDSARDSGEGSDGLHAELSVLYGMAENEALGEAINSIEEILAAARTLFGTQTFLEVNATM